MTRKSISISFEFFPPKTVEGKATLTATAKKLIELQPQFFSVTFGAGGSTREGTLETVRNLQMLTTGVIAPHLSCIGSSREDILQMLDAYKSAGIWRLVTLRGDLPSGMGHAGEFKYASELVTLIREVTGDFFHIEVAAYPEIHPQALNPQDDVLNLKRKCDAGANGAITQYFFNPDSYFYYLDECARLNINIPIIPGIMPIIQYSKLARFSEACGAEIPRWIRKRFESFGDDAVSVQAFGLEIVTDLCENLLRNGAPGLHFYTLNQAELSVKIIDQLKSNGIIRIQNGSAVLQSETS